MAHIDSLDSDNLCFRVQSSKLYSRANLEGQKLKFKESRQYKLFSSTKNSCKEIENIGFTLKESTIDESVKVGADSSIIKSVVADEVIIGSKVKISNSIILSGCQIGDGVTIQNSIVLTKCTIKPNSKVSE